MITNNKTSFWLASQYSISLFLSLVGLKLNLLNFGGQTFSIWLLLVSIWGIGGAVDFGFGLSTVKFIAQYRNNFVKISTIVSTAFYLFVLLGVLLLITGFSISEMFYLHNPKIIPSNTIHFSRIICYISGLTFYMSYITVIFKSILEGHEDFIRTAKITLTFNVLTFLFICIVYLLHETIIVLAFSYSVSTLLQLIAYCIILLKRYPNIKISLKFVKLHTFKEIFKFSASIQISNFIFSLIDPVTKYLIGNFTQNRMIPPYEIAKRFSLAISGLFSFSFRNALPAISKISNPDNYSEFLNSEGIKLSRYAIAFSGLFFGVCSLIFILIFKVFYGYNESATMFLLLAMAESVNITGFILYIFLLGIGKSAFLIAFQAMNVVFISLFLITGYHLFSNSIGLIGLFVSVVVCNSIILHMVKRIASFAILDFLKKIHIWKLLVLHALIFLDVCMLMTNSHYWLISQISLSAICLLIFYVETGVLIKATIGTIISFRTNKISR